MFLNPHLSRVMLIEDDTDDCDVFKWAIEDISPGIQLEICQSCIVAQELIAHFAPQIIFLDLRLPFKHGLIFLKELQADADTREIPVVIYSSHSNPDEIAETIKLGAKIYLEKPDSFMTLTQRLEHILTKKPLELAEFRWDDMEAGQSSSVATSETCAI